MARFLPLFIALAAVLTLIGTWQLFGKSEAERYRRVQQLRRAPSDISLWLVVRRQKGEPAREEYRMADHDGLSSESYAVLGRDGTRVRVESLPRETYDVAFFFEHAVQDGIWELPDRPPRGDTSVEYTIGVEQSVEMKHGAHTLRFTDPHYWATTGGRQYHLRLEHDKPVPDLLRLQSTSLAEPRYERLVEQFRAFGSAGFRAKVTAVRRKLDGK